MPAGHSHSPRKLTAHEIKQILTSQGSIRSIAKQIGRPHATVSNVLHGRTHIHVHPELPRRIRNTGLTCLNCLQWAGRRCKLDFPDPIEEGPSFAAECNSYKAAKSSTIKSSSS